MFAGVIMLPRLAGLKESISTQKVMQILDDAGIRYEFIDLITTSSRSMEMMVSLTGSNELPQFFIGGEHYIGTKQIRGYIRS